jgi:acyl carrier protein
MEDTIKRIIFDKFKLEVDKNTPISQFVEDSISRVEMLFEIEQALNIRLSEEDILSVVNCGDLFKAANNSLKNSVAK